MAPQEFTKKFFDLTDKANEIFITSHKNPDDDSVSSTLAIYDILSQKYPNKSINIIYITDFDTRWKSFKNFDKLQKGEIADLANDSSLIIVLDVAQYDRFSDNPDKLRNLKCPKICIDHHSSEPDDFDLKFIKSTVSSASQVIYELFNKDGENLDQSLAETYFLGIYGDTGGLQFIKPEQSSLFSIVQKLIEVGKIDIQVFSSKIRGYSTRVLEIIQELVKNIEIKKIGNWPEFLCSYVSKDFLSQNNYTDVEIDSGTKIFIASYGTSVKEASWGMVFYWYNDGRLSGSLRSRPESVNVRILAENLGLGGGHDRAAGIKAKGLNLNDSSEFLDYVVNWMKENEACL